jgi:hypothetical protein
MLRAAVACACLLAVAAPAAADWHITPMAGLTFAGKTTIQDVEKATGNVHPALGIAVTFLAGGPVGVEAMGVMTTGFFQSNAVDLVESSRTTALMGNVVLTVPRRWAEYSLRPFASGGLGLMRASQRDKLDLFSITSNVAGFNIGGGAIGYLSKRTGVRFDVRYYSNLHGVDQGAVATGNVHLRYMTASVGFIFRR